MPLASLQNAEISYLDEGEGDPILLIHGFASRKEVNWVATGWVKDLVAAGFRVIAADNRGHGQSTKFYEESDYRLPKMAADMMQLLDFLNVPAVHVLGYSMGARISSRIALDHGSRVNKLVLAGNGYGMIEGTGNWNTVRDALLTSEPDTITDPRGIAFRKFADQTSSDRKALAACVTGARETFTEADFAAITNDTMVAIGTDDDVAGSGERLASLIPAGTYLPIPGRDHMKAVGDREFKRGAIEFLTG